MAVQFRLHLLTLGVDDVERAARFYAALGMKRHMQQLEGVAFFDAGGAVLALYGRDALAADTSLGQLPAGSGSATFAFNVGEEAAVAETLDLAERAGGTILKPPFRPDWGGVVGYFADPDAHVWEVAYNPGFPFDERGLIALPA